jgi:hypothetical protein
MNDLLFALVIAFIVIPAGILIALIIGNFLYLTYRLMR